MGIKRFFERKKKIDYKAPTPEPTPTIQYDKPIGPEKPVFQGPTRPGTDVETFRETGRSIPTSGGGGSGGAGGGGSVPAPTPTPSQTISPSIQATRDVAKEARELRVQAKEKGVSPEVLARQKATEGAISLREVARERGEDISTPVRQQAFIKKLQQEQVSEVKVDKESFKSRTVLLRSPIDVYKIETTPQFPRRETRIIPAPTPESVRKQEEIKKRDMKFIKDITGGLSIEGIERTPTQKFVREKGEKVIEFIEKKEQKFVERLRPDVKRERQIADILKKEKETLEKDIDKFNKKYQGAELSQTQYNKAISEQNNLQSRTEKFNKKLQNFQEKTADTPGRGFRAFGIGLVTAPFALTSFSTGLLIDPSRESSQIIKGISQIPLGLKEKPFETTGGLVGSITGQAALFRIGGGIKQRAKLRFAEGKVKDFVVEKPKLPQEKKTPLSRTFDDRVFEPSKAQLKSLRRFKEQRTLEKAKSESPVGKRIKLEEALKEELALRKTLQEKGMLKGDIDIQKFALDKSKPLFVSKPSKAQLKSLRRFKEQRTLEKAKSESPVGKRIKLEEALKEELALRKTLQEKGMLKGDIDIQKFALDKSKPLFVSKPSKAQLKSLRRFKFKERVKKPEFEFTIDTSELSRQAARLRSGADIVTISKKGLQIQEKKPRFKQPKISEIQKLALKRAVLQKLKDKVIEQPKIKRIRTLKDFDKPIKTGVVVEATQKGTQQVILEKPKQIQLPKQKVKLEQETKTPQKQLQQ